MTFFFMAISTMLHETEFTLSFRSFNGSEFHIFDLRKADAIRVEIDCEEGAFSVTIQKDGEKPVYCGSDLFPADFR